MHWINVGYKGDGDGDSDDYDSDHTGFCTCSKACPFKEFFERPGNY